MISWEDFEKIDIRVGTIISATLLPKAKIPAYQLNIDFGPEGTRQSSARITALYQPENLVGRQVISVINFPPKLLAGFKSECLVLGIYNENNDVVLLQPERPVGNGHKIG